MKTVKEIEMWREAGRIAGEVLRFLTNTKIRRGAGLVKICEEGEKLIVDRGAKPAFPINISINEIAAHYTPPPFSTEKIRSNSFVKVDVGVHLQGYIGDTAKTIFIGTPNQHVEEILKAGEEVLNVAIEKIRDGVRISEISKEIYNKAKELGYGVLIDLNGHSIERYKLHSGITIPNTPSAISLLDRTRSPKLKKGMIVAIEPFLVSSKKDSRTIEDKSRAYIYSLRENGSGLAYKKLYGLFRTLPFALRWIVKKRSQLKPTVKLLNSLAKKGYLNVYPTLVDRSGNIVVQFEHTILVKDSSAEVLTYPT